jgi:hypothetical protein
MIVALGVAVHGTLSGTASTIRFHVDVEGRM